MYEEILRDEAEEAERGKYLMYIQHRPDRQKHCDASEREKTY